MAAWEFRRDNPDPNPKKNSKASKPETELLPLEAADGAVGECAVLRTACNYVLFATVQLCAVCCVQLSTTYCVQLLVLTHCVQY